MQTKIQKITMPIDNNESANFWTKAGLYLIGIILGLGAKLAVMNKEKPLTVRDFILHGFIAFACAWLVWAILAHYDYLDFANIASVIVGRYADFILVAIWKSIKKSINTDNPKL